MIKKILLLTMFLIIYNTIQCAAASHANTKECNEGTLVLKNDTDILCTFAIKPAKTPEFFELEPGDSKTFKNFKIGNHGFAYAKGDRNSRDWFTHKFIISPNKTTTITFKRIQKFGPELVRLMKLYEHTSQEAKKEIMFKTTTEIATE